MTEQEKMGNRIIEGRKLKPYLSAHQVHDNILFSDALDEINADSCVNLTQLSPNGNGASH